MTALQAAAEAGHFEIARYLLKAGAEVNALGSTHHFKPHRALKAAIKKGRLDVVYLLLEAEADMNLRRKQRKDSRVAEHARKKG